MPTLGVRVQTTLASSKQKIPVADLYKGVPVSGLRTEMNKTLSPGESFEADLSDTTFVCVLVEAFSEQSKSIDVEVTTTAERIPDEETGDDFLVAPNVLTFKTTSILALEASNLEHIKITNSNTESKAVFTLIR